MIQHTATLDEMRKDIGVVESFTIGRNCAASLTLRTDDVTLKQYSFCEPDEKLPQRVRGKRAMVWSEGRVYPPIQWGRNLMQLQVDGIDEHKFNPHYHEDVSRLNKIIIKLFLPFVLIPLFRIWWVNRKAEPDRLSDGGGFFKSK